MARKFLYAKPGMVVRKDDQEVRVTWFTLRATDEYLVGGSYLVGELLPDGIRFLGEKITGLPQLMVCAAIAQAMSLENEPWEQLTVWCNNTFYILARLENEAVLSALAEGVRSQKPFNRRTGWEALYNAERRLPTR